MKMDTQRTSDSALFPFVGAFLGFASVCLTEPSRRSVTDRRFNILRGENTLPNANKRQPRAVHRCLFAFSRAENAHITVTNILSFSYHAFSIIRAAKNKKFTRERFGDSKERFRPKDKREVPFSSPFTDIGRVI